MKKKLHMPGDRSISLAITFALLLIAAIASLAAIIQYWNQGGGPILGFLCFFGVLVGGIAFLLENY